MTALGEENRIIKSQNVQSYNHSFTIPPPQNISSDISWVESLESWVNSRWNWSGILSSKEDDIRYVLLVNFDKWPLDSYDKLARIFHSKFEKINGDSEIGDSNWKNITFIAIVEPDWILPNDSPLTHWIAPLPCLTRLPTHQEVIKTTVQYLGKDLVFRWKLPESNWSWGKWWKELQLATELKQKRKKMNLYTKQFEYLEFN